MNLYSRPSVDPCSHVQERQSISIVEADKSGSTPFPRSLTHQNIILLRLRSRQEEVEEQLLSMGVNVQVSREGPVKRKGFRLAWAERRKNELTLRLDHTTPSSL